MRFVLAIIVPIVLLFVCALVIMWLPLPAPFPPSLSRGRTIVAAAVVGVLGIGYLFGLTVYLIASVRQMGRVLDPLLLARGLAVPGEAGLARRYLGQIDGRRVEVTFVPARALEDPQLLVYVSADAGARAAVGTSRPLLDCQGCARVDSPAVPDLEVYAEDAGWAGKWLARPDTVQALEQLFGGPESQGTRELYVQPERLWLRSRPRRIDLAQVDRWLDALLALAESAEGVA